MWKRLTEVRPGTEELNCILMSVACFILSILHKSSACMVALSAAMLWTVYGIRYESLRYTQTLVDEIIKLKTEKEDS